MASKACRDVKELKGKEVFDIGNRALDVDDSDSDCVSVPGESVVASSLDRGNDTLGSTRKWYLAVSYTGRQRPENDSR